MERKTTAYEVKVQPTNGVGDQFCIDGRYLDCKDGVVIVVTDSPADIFAKWGDKVYSVRRIGPAVDMSPNAEHEARALASRAPCSCSASGYDPECEWEGHHHA